MHSHQDRLGAIATFLQRNEDVLLYAPDGIEEALVEMCPFPHPHPLPLLEAVEGLTTCPCCERPGVPLGCDAWYAESDPVHGEFLTRTYLHEEPCACVWRHRYLVAADGRAMRYHSTESFGLVYLWSTAQQAVPSVLKDACREQ